MAEKTPPYADKSALQQRANALIHFISTSHKFCKGQKITRVSIMVSGSLDNHPFNDIIVWGDGAPLEIPLQQLRIFFEALATHYVDLEGPDKFFATAVRKKVGHGNKSKCCDAPLASTDKPSTFFPGETTIDYIYCSECNSIIDNYGIGPATGKFHQPKKLI